MSKHDIEASLPAHNVVNTDLNVVVRSDGKRLGELLISKGSIDWRPARRQSSISLTWEQFARLVERWHVGEVK
jgi:hypothetical protein